MKAKLDWVTGKIERIGGSNKRPADWPDTAGLTVGFICNLLRMQRNDLGHPQPTVPKTSTEDAFIHNPKGVTEGLRNEFRAGLRYRLPEDPAWCGPTTKV
jgi:hypothetical protein